MLPVSKSHPLTFNKTSLLKGAVLFVALSIIFAVGAYFFIRSCAPVSYVLFGVGGSIGIASFIALLVRRLKPSKVSPEVAEGGKVEPPQAVPTELPPPPPLSKKRKALAFNFSTKELYAPKLETYFREIGNETQAKELLEKGGKEKGDYVICKEDDYNIVILYLGENGEIKKHSGFNPLRAYGQIYTPDYEQLKYPVLPEGSQCEESAIHHSMLCLKFTALMKTIDEERDSRPFPTGLMHEFARWIQNHTQPLDFNPYRFFSIIGHVFNLPGKYTYKYKGANSAVERECTVRFEGTANDFGRSILMQDLTDYVQNSNLEKEIKENILSMATHAYVTGRDSKNPSLETLLTLLNEGKPITIFSGWKGHSVNITLTKKFLVFTNKGDQANGKPGHHLYSIGKEITKVELIQLLQERDASFFLPSSSKSPLEELLELEKKEFIPSASQKAGNCVFANNKQCLKSALLSLGVSQEDCNAHSKNFTVHSRLFWLKTLFSMIERCGHDQSLKRELFFLLLLITAKFFCKAKFKGKILESGDAKCPVMLQAKIQELLNTHPTDPYLLQIKTTLEGKKINLQNLPSPSHRQILAELIFTLSLSNPSAMIGTVLEGDNS